MQMSHSRITLYLTIIMIIANVSVCISFNQPRNPLSVVSDWITEYRAEIVQKIELSLEKFRKHQLKITKSAEDDVKIYLESLNSLYDDALRQLRTQQAALEEFNNFNPSRSPVLDDSLDQFKRAYNESLEFVFKLPQTGANHISKYSIYWRRKSKQAHRAPNTLESFAGRIEKLDKTLQNQWDAIVEASREVTTSTDRMWRQSLSDINKIQENITSNAKALSENSRQNILQKGNIKDIKQERQALESQLKKLEKDGRVWIDERVVKLEMALKSMQERVSTSSVLYEELLAKRKGSFYYTAMNDATLNKVLKLIDSNDEGWQLIRSQDGVSVFRKFIGGGVGGQSSFKYACVKAEGVMQASPKLILDLFEDNTRVTEYNKFFQEGRDLENVADNTKVVWACAPPIFPFKPRDFCTIVHFRKLKDGTVVVLNRAAEHPDAPVSSDFVRAKIVLGANILQPIPGNPHQCKFTMITQICTLGPVGFFKQVEAAARRPASRDVLELKKKNSGPGVKFTADNK
eukprot:gene572-1101_t